MKTKIIYAIGGAVFAALLLMVIGLASHQSVNTSLGSAVGQPTFDSATSSVKAVGTTATSTMKLGSIYPVGSATSNTGRIFASLQNVSSQPVFCQLSATSTGLSSSTYGFVLNASSTVNNYWATPTGGTLYTGQIWCLTATGTANVAITEK
ncbi:hypothetical protein M1506_00255 [Patescibacteria group bacterium]|nr:hypothetical protein [Patescibacteria group bacterium]